MLKDRIYNDLVECMKNKDKEKLSVLRMVKGALQLEATNKGVELTDEVVITVLSREIKQRNESVREFRNASRDDLAVETEKEIKILQEYLPEQLSEEEIVKIIDEAFNKVNPTSEKEMGLIMREVSPKLKGKADMSVVSKMIKDRLS